MIQTYINPQINRADWGPGPWDEEPDKVSWTDEVTGLSCLAVRNWMGSWCGYVAVEPGHPYHGSDYDDVRVDVHGGLTFSAGCAENEPIEGSVCHVPEPGRSGDVWWLGWDAGHWNDIQPGMVGVFRNVDIDITPHGTYKTLGYVRAQCAHLARQLSVDPEETASRIEQVPE